MPHTGSNDAPVRHEALAGLRVVDFSIIMSGPMCTRMLADSGADVIKVEAPGGDVVRQRPPQLDGHSTYFASLNCGKRSVVLDLQTEEGRALARGLALEADVVVENYRPGVMKRLGLDHDSLSRENPRLIYCSISGFGQEGPLSGAPAYAPVIHAASGYEQAYAQYQGPDRGARPANNGIFMADVLGAAYAAYAIQLALFDRERTGQGQHIDVALFDSVLGMLVYEMQAAQFPQTRPRQVYEPVRTRDGYVMVAAVTPKNQEVLFDVIGYPEGKTDARFASVRSKEENWSALLAIIEGWTSQRTSAECEQTLLAAGVPCSRYRTVGEAMNAPQTLARGTMSRLEAGGEPFLVANQSFKLSRARTEARALIARLGQHTDEVLQEVLGCDAGWLQDLRARGVLGGASRTD
jgi:CoA:oxalate CoA-transferase